MMCYKSSRKVIPEQLFFPVNAHIYIPLFLADTTIKIQAVWELELENGARDAGQVKRNRIQFNRLPIGCHKLTLILGQPLLGKGTEVYQSTLNILAH